MAFASRIRCYALWQNTEAELRRIKQSHEKARLQGRISQDRIGHSLAQLAEAERKALSSRQDFERCSRLIKDEMARFEEERVRDFKSSMQSFVEGMLKRQQQLIATWEDYQIKLLRKVDMRAIGDSLAA